MKLQSQSTGLSLIEKPQLSILDVDAVSWYVSKNGTDSSQCGRNDESACATFHGLWRYLVRGKADNNKVIANTDLIIENMHLHSTYRKFTFQNSASYLIGITITNTTIEKRELNFNGGNISVRIEDSLIRSSAMRENIGPLWRRRLLRNPSSGIT